MADRKLNHTLLLKFTYRRLPERSQNSGNMFFQGLPLTPNVRAQCFLHILDISWALAQLCAAARWASLSYSVDAAGCRRCARSGKPPCADRKDSISSTRTRNDFWADSLILLFPVSLPGHLTALPWEMLLAPSLPRSLTAWP